MRKEEQDAQQKHIDQGHGGGIEQSLALAKEGDFRLFSGKFLISNEDYESFREICEYWEDKCLMEQGDRFWKADFAQADFIEKGWAIGLYTAPHEPCPEGRLVLDYEMALSKGYGRIIAEIDRSHRLLPANGHSRRRRSSTSGARPSARWRGRWASRKTTPKRPAPGRRRAGSGPSGPGCSRWPTPAAACLPRRPAISGKPCRRSGSPICWATSKAATSAIRRAAWTNCSIPILKTMRRCSYDEAVELFEELFVKMTQIEYVASLSWQGLGHGNLYQNCILGGLDEQGKPADNETSLAILDAQIHMQMTQPTLSVWYDDSLSEKFLLKAVECVKTGVRLSGVLQPEDLRRARTQDQRSASEYDPQARGHRRLHRARAPGHELRRGAGGLRQSRQAPGPDNERRRGPAHAIAPFRTGGAQRPTKTSGAPSATRCTPPSATGSATGTTSCSPTATPCRWFSARCSCEDCLGRGRCMDDGGAVLNSTPTTLPRAW